MSAVYPSDEPEERHRDEDERSILDRIQERISVAGVAKAAYFIGFWCAVAYGVGLAL